MAINSCPFLSAVLVTEVVLYNFVECSSKTQEFKRPDVFHVSLPGCLFKNDFASDTTGKVSHKQE